MAQKNTSQQNTNSFKQLDTDVKLGKIPPVVFLYGKEQYLVQWSINMIINRYVNKATESLDVTRIEPEDATLDAIISANDTLSMFSEKRVVVLPDFVLLANPNLEADADDNSENKPKKRNHQSNFSKEDEDSLCKYICSLCGENDYEKQGTILIFTADITNGSNEKDQRAKIERTKLYKEIAKCGKVYCFDTLTPKELESFIIKRLKRAGKYCKRIVIEELITMSGYYHKEADYTLFNLENDLKKIIAHSESEEIILADVLSTVSGNIETNVFAMIDALGRGRKDEVYRLLFNILNSGEKVYTLLAMIVSQYELILQVKELRSEGLNIDMIKDKLNVHEFRVKKAWSLGDKYSNEILKKILLKAYEIDINIKSGLLEENLALEMFVAQI